MGGAKKRRAKKNGIPIKAVGMLLGLLLMAALACPAYAAEPNNRVITVAVTGCSNFLEIDQNGNATGYAQGYLDEVADYTGWSYAYREMSFAEALTALQNGEIDLVPGLQRWAPREALFHFSTYDMGETSTILCVREDSTQYYYNDFVHYDGMVVGEVQGSSCGALLQEKMSAVGGAVTIREYATEEALHAALETGEVDAVTYSKLHRTSQYRMIASFHPAFLYMGLNPQNEEINARLNAAMEQIKEDSPYFCSKLETEYYENLNTNLCLSPEEQDYINRHDTIKVALSTDLAPMEFYSQETGAFEGFTVKYFELLSKKTGLQFQYVPRDDVDSLRKQGETQAVQMVGIIAVNGVADLIHAEETDSPYSNTLSLIYKASHENRVDTDSVAIMAGYPYFRQAAEDLGYRDIKEYATARECALAVKRGEADSAVLSSVIVSMVLNHAYFDSLTSMELSETKIAYCFGVFQSEDSHILLNIINKGIRNLPEEDVKNARIAALMGYQPEPTWIDRVYESKTLLLVGFFLLVLALFVLVARRSARARAKEVQRLFKYVCHVNKRVLEYDLKGQTRTEYFFRNDRLCMEKRKFRFEQEVEKRMSPEDRKSLADVLTVEKMKSLARNEEEFVFEARLKQEDGSYRWHIITLNGTNPKGKSPCTCMCFIRDIQSLKEQEEENRQVLTDALQQAENASKAKGDFMSRMSHEIRTPLNAIIGYLEIARDEKEDLQRIDYCMEKSQVASRHLLSIINDVLDISSIESGRLKIAHEDFDLKQMVNALTVLFYAQTKEKGINFEVHLDALEQEWLCGDELRVRQVLLNLLSNAVKFTPAGGSIYLNIRQIRSVGQVQSRIRLQFEVQDTGIGISEEYRARMFTPFEQESASTARNYGGTGLGLSISQNLVRMMGGDIHVESEQGKGTTFRVLLAFDSAKKEQEQPPATDSFQNLRALVVDDEPDTCSYIKKLFDRLGMQCDTVTSGKKALRRMLSRLDSAHPYDLCIIDWYMEEMDGVETAKEVRKLCGAEMPIIIATAYDYSSIVEQAKAAGVDKIVSKPLFQSTLLDLLVSTYGRYRPTRAEKPVPVNLAGVKLLLAEDNEMNMEIAVDILKKAGFLLTPVTNGQEALDAFVGAQPGTFDAILMDIQMPVMDGYTATRKIRESDHPQAKSIPIIAMTANAFTEDVTAALAAGMNDHVAKPISYDRLFQVLGKYVNGGRE